MGYFMLGTYAVLSLLAWFLALQGASLLEVLSIFIYPTGFFAFYLYFLWQQSNAPAFQNGTICREVLGMTQSVDAPAQSFDKVMDSLEKEFGDALNCDMRSYMGGAGNG